MCTSTFKTPIPTVHLTFYNQLPSIKFTYFCSSKDHCTCTLISIFFIKMVRVGTQNNDAFGNTNVFQHESEDVVYRNGSQFMVALCTWKTFLLRGVSMFYPKRSRIVWICSSGAKLAVDFRSIIFMSWLLNSSNETYVKAIWRNS